MCTLIEGAFQFDRRRARASQFLRRSCSSHFHLRACNYRVLWCKRITLLIGTAAQQFDSVVSSTPCYSTDGRHACDVITPWRAIIGAPYALVIWLLITLARVKLYLRVRATGDDAGQLSTTTFVDTPIPDVHSVRRENRRYKTEPTRNAI